MELSLHASTHAETYTTQPGPTTLQTSTRGTLAIPRNEAAVDFGSFDANKTNEIYIQPVSTIRSGYYRDRPGKLGTYTAGIYHKYYR